MLTEKQRFVASLAATIAAAIVGDPSNEINSRSDIVSVAVDYAIMICEEVCDRDSAPPVPTMPIPGGA